jgi:hypothetical protein
MHNKILDSVRFYHEGRILAAIGSVQAHFKEKFNEELLASDISLENLAINSMFSWDHFFVQLLKSHWSQQIRLGLVFQELWQNFPSSAFPYILARFDFMDFSSFLSWQYDEAVVELRLNELFDILREGVQSGKILTIPYEEPFGLFPVITDDFYEFLEQEQLSDEFAEEIKSSIQEGIAARKQDFLTKLPTLHFDFVARYFIKELFLPPNKINLIANKLNYFSARFPDRSRVVSQGLRNHMDSIPSDDDLSDFIFLYTGGRVLTEDPRGWMRLFIQSVETGKVLMPLG